MIPLALLKFAGAVAPYAIVAALAVGAYQTAPLIGVNAQRHRLATARDQYRTEAVAWHKNADGWRASFDKSEGVRATETQEARRAVEADAASCTLRVADARRSAVAIRKVLDEPVKLDANRCPLRRIISADELRDALEGTAPGS